MTCEFATYGSICETKQYRDVENSFLLKYYCNFSLFTRKKLYEIDVFVLQDEKLLGGYIKFKLIDGIVDIYYRNNQLSVYGDGTFTFTKEGNSCSDLEFLRTAEDYHITLKEQLKPFSNYWDPSRYHVTCIYEIKETPNYINDVIFSNSQESYINNNDFAFI